MFLAWVAHPRTGVLPILVRLDSGDRFNAFTRAVGSASFAVPPGSGPATSCQMPLELCHLPG